MGADVSRVRFDPRRDFAGVVMQQGRVLLDADWNELVTILERRIRAGVADLDSPGPTPGLGGVAVVPRTTPDAFEVTASAGALTIGRGRMYVDGLLAENHGLGPDVLDPLLAEVHGSADPSYSQQPYWPAPDPLPASGTHLAYLDVWQREVTHVEDPGLLEPAVGVDSTARTQTVWQVRLHPLDSTATGCSTPDADVPGWLELTAPSGARLTVDTIEVTDTEDPCALPPTGGYRGLENQTYRVEVHAGGQPGTATFKWSRDNGSVVSPVLEVLSAGQAVRPASYGRDSVLRFKDGDWVEFTDDHRELGRLPGELRRIEVHEEDGTLKFTPALPADLQLTATQAAARHLRVRRWDQKGRIRSATGTELQNLDSATSSGAITVPASSATSVQLESGLVISFSSSGADFRTGDHWIVPARTADTAFDPGVDAVVDAPPLGIHHHYARLAVVTFPDTATDCRTLWPAECSCEGGSSCGDCTVCVTVESHASGALTIQEAVAQVVQLGGGTVCLEAGVFHLEKGVVIEGASSVRVRGQGLRTVVIARQTAFSVSNSAFVTLQDLTVLGAGGAPGMELRGTVGATVERVTVLVVGESQRVPSSGIRLGGVSLLTTLRDNVVVAGVGVSGGGDSDGERRTSLLTAELDVRDNLLLCRSVGVSLDGRVGHLLGNTVSANTVLRAESAGIRLRGTILPGHGFEVTGNTLLVGGTGIEVGTAGFTVDANEVTGTGESLERRSDGVAVVLGSLDLVRGTTRVMSNLVRDVGGRGVAVLAPTSTLVVSHNVVERAMQGIVMDERARASAAVVSDNGVSDVGARPSDEASGVAGIQVVAAGRATVESNVVHGVGAAREVGDGSAGIRVLACPESRVADNSVDRVGFPESGGQDVGIAVQGGIGRTQVVGNQVRRQPVPIDEDPSPFQGLVVGGEGDARQPALTMTASYVVADGPTGFAIGGLAAHAVAARQSVVTVDANVVSGGAELPAALVAVAGEVIATGNHLHSNLDGGPPALRLVATAASVSANRLRGGRPSAALDVDPERLAVLGNLTTSGISVLGGPLDQRWDPLNLNGI